MNRTTLIILITLIIMSGWVTFSYAQGVYTSPNQVQGEGRKSLNLPYVFYNDSFGIAAAYVYGEVGYPQPQSTLVATAMAGTKGSAMGFLAGRDIQLPLGNRLFVDPVLSVGYFSDQILFVDGNPDYDDEQAGSNDSDENNYVEGDGWDYFYRIKFKYLLPMGSGRDEIISTYVIKDGLLIDETGHTYSLNPFESGKTYLEFRPFYRLQAVDGDDLDDEIKTNGITAGLYWDNRDFYANPTSGFSARTSISKDYGWLDSSDTWTNVSGELDWYFPLGSSERFRQRVIAFDFFTSYSPSWDVQEDGSTDHRPPAYTGSSLGGVWRMRGFPNQRFSDKAAIYYALEARLTTVWNPFDNWPWLQKHVGIEWLQFVPFVEVGRVAPAWQMNELHSDMKLCAGLGVRAWAMGIVARVDTAVSEEDMKVQMMISQPFQF